MVRWICDVKASDRLSVDSLCNCLVIEPLSALIRLRHLGWIGRCLSLDVVRKSG